MDGTMPKYEKTKKKVNYWNIGLILLLLAVCIVIWEAGQYYYYEWKLNIYELGYNQSRTDTILLIANSGNYPVYAQGENGTVLIFGTLQQICGAGQ